MSTVATNRNHEFKRHSEHLDQQHINSRTALTTTKHKQVPLKIGHLEQGCFDVQTPRQMACKLTISTKHTTIDPFWNHREKPKQNIDGGWREAWSKLPERLTSYGTPRMTVFGIANCKTPAKWLQDLNQTTNTGSKNVPCQSADVN